MTHVYVVVFTVNNIFHNLPNLLGRNNLFIAQDLECEGTLAHKSTAAGEGAVESVREKQEAL